MADRKNESTFVASIRLPLAWKSHIQRHQLSVTDISRDAVLEVLYHHVDDAKHGTLCQALERAQENQRRQRGPTGQRPRKKKPR